MSSSSSNTQHYCLNKLVIELNSLKEFYATTNIPKHILANEFVDFINYFHKTVFEITIYPNPEVPQISYKTSSLKKKNK